MTSNKLLLPDLAQGRMTLMAWLDAEVPDLGGHCGRVSDLTVALGVALNLSADRLALLAVTALLHDIGKLDVPLEVLERPGPLRPADWILIKAHPVFSVQRAAALPTMTMAQLDAIHAHHERWDGAGYPRGLQGADIPLEARMIAVCDVYDALVSPRPYKPAWTADAALAELRRGCGTAFDPAVLAPFLQLHGIDH